MYKNDKKGLIPTLLVDGSIQEKNTDNDQKVA